MSAAALASLVAAVSALLVGVAVLGVAAAAAVFLLLRSGALEEAQAIAAALWPNRFRTRPLTEWPSLKDGRPLTYEEWQNENTALFNGSVGHDGWSANGAAAAAPRRIHVSW